MRETSLQIIVHLVLDRQGYKRCANSLTIGRFANDGNKKSHRPTTTVRQLGAGGSMGTQN
nr:MAG TPA: hypothetical protein [Caudoviricetes sp.]